MEDRSPILPQKESEEPFDLSPLASSSKGWPKLNGAKGFTLRVPQGERRQSLIGVEGEGIDQSKCERATRYIMSFWVYILVCADGSYYTGHTDDLEKRIAEHQSGELGGYTSTRLPAKLVFSQEFPTREEAIGSEQRIKGWNRKKKDALIRGDWAEVSRLANLRGIRPSSDSMGSRKEQPRSC